VLHFLLYTASNGFNSYYDRDAESIGALRRPPVVTPDLLWLSLGLDGAAVLLAFTVNWGFAAGCFIYGLASKAYSWDKIRIKKHPVIGWLWAGIGQGTLTFLLVVLSVNSTSLRGAAGFGVWFPAMAAGLFVLGIFPITQIYQHREDSQHGDVSMSMKLGVRGTFILSALFMGSSVAAFFAFFLLNRGAAIAIGFLTATASAAIYFFHWAMKAARDRSTVDYDHTTRLCIIASTGINLFGLAVLVLAKG
jgi:1,4-dihydroxy-2-naphthoate octaprenyltransferase